MTPTLQPYLSVAGAAEAIEFYKRAFGAIELYRLEEPSGRIGHAELQLGNAILALADEYPEYGIRGPLSVGGTSCTLVLYVEDVDQVAARAVEAGATQESPVKDEFYGDRVTRLKDPFGHRWSIHTQRENLSVEELKSRFQALFQS